MQDVRLRLVESVVVDGKLIPMGTFICLPYDAFIQAFPEHRSKPASFMDSVVNKATESFKRGPGRPAKQTA